MKNRLILSITLLSLMALTFACGGAATNSNNSNTNKSNMMSNSSNMMSNSSNMMSNTAYNTAANKPANTTTNTAANKPANTASNTTAANKVATTQKPPKGATALCKDGTYSFSKTESGQCSSHGGVDKKF